MTPASLLLAATLACASDPTPPPDAAVSDAGELQGEWEVVGCVWDGDDNTRDHRGYTWVFAGPFASICDAAGRTCWTPSAVRADPAADPPRVDLATRDKGRLLGIYRRTGDTLVWAWGAEGPSEPRPSSFEPAPASSSGRSAA